MTVLRSRTIYLFVVAIFAALFLVACGGNNTYSPTGVSGTPAPAQITLAITPSTATTTPGGTVPFHAIVTGTSNTAVTWSVVSPNGGTIDANGLYTAPLAVVALSKVRDTTTSTAKYTIQAVTQATPQQTATAVVSVVTTTTTVTPIAVTINPQPASIYPGGTFQFSATVSGTTNQGVTWSVLTANGGGITQAGLYTAPGPNDGIKKAHRAAPADTQSVTIQAVSKADSTKSATATITVSDLIIAISPTNPTVVEGQTVTFTAKVTGPANAPQGVSWYGDDGGGTINQTTGVLTAGYKPGEYQILCYSNAENGQQAFTDFTVVAPPNISVSIAPANVFLALNQTQQFTATVKGTTSQAVIWSVVLVGTGQQYGTVSSTGLYTAPGFIPGLIAIQVQATSVADPTKSATATVNLNFGT